MTITSLSLAALALFIPLLMRGCHAVDAVRGMFVFGSSHVDNGNINFLRNSTSRVDYLPYGIDFPLGPTGRFSNGRNVIDVLGELLKLPGLLPPSGDLTARGRRIIHGLNFAYGGSGILDTTGAVATGNTISMNQQIRNFESILNELRNQLRMQGTQDFHQELSRYMFVIGTGGNDYLLNYFSATKLPFPKLLSSLITTLSSQIKKLYDLGARKFVLLSIQPVGCAPVVRSLLGLSNETCLESMNNEVELYNARLKSLVDDNKDLMPRSKMVFLHSYKIIKDVIVLDGPSHRSLKERTTPCCELSSTGVLCKKGGGACTGRRRFVFFDGLHLTEEVNNMIGLKAYASRDDNEVYPINVMQLAQLQITRG